MDRLNVLLAAGHRGADAFDSYVKLQWIGFYAIAAFAVISMMSLFIWMLSRLFGKLSFNRRQERLHRELKAQIEERDELIQVSEMKQQKMRNAMSNIQDRIDLMDNKLYRVDAMNTSLNELRDCTSTVMDKLSKISVKKVATGPKRKVGRPRKRDMRKAPRK